MKIVGMEEFLELPLNTIYVRYKPNILSDNLEVFHGRTNSNSYDFFYKNIITELDTEKNPYDFEILAEAEEKGTSFELDFYCGSRDGHCCDADSLFAIYEKEDVKGLLGVVTEIYENYGE